MDVQSFVLISGLGLQILVCVHNFELILEGMKRLKIKVDTKHFKFQFN